MRYLIAFVLVLVSSSIAGAQETYSVTAPAPYVATVTALVKGANIATCVRFAIAPASCTQAAACTAAGAAGGAGCSPAQARAAGARIFPQTTAGREEYLSFSIVIPTLDDRKQSLPVVQTARRCANWAQLDQASKDAECTRTPYPGLEAGCDLGCGQ